MIVVADDDKVLSQLIRQLLEDAGYDTRVANNGEEAYDLVREEACDAMILDIRMPGVNGAELLLLMAAERIHVPVIVIAGFPDFDEEEMKQFPNVKNLFQKPLYPEEILEAVKNIAPPPASD